MSISDSSPILGGVATPEAVSIPARKFDVKAMVLDRTFQWVMLILAATIFCYWPLFGVEIWHRWSDMEGYYAHGFLIPLCCGYLIWDRWDRIKDIEVKPFWPAVILIVPILFVTLAASRCIMPTLLSGLFVATLLVGTLMVAGWKWLIALAPAHLFMLLGMPIFDKLIDRGTMPLQLMSTKIAYHLLNLTGFQPLREGDTTLYVPHFNQALTVAAACSGLKTTIAISAAVIFFMLIARLNWWKNLILASMAIPLSVLINGLRIGLIGVLCDTMPEWSNDNFKQMHDMSGYVALFVCFIVLGWTTKKMGYK